MLLCMILTVLGALLLVLYLFEKIRKYSVRAAFLKSLVSILFVAVALCAFQASGRGRSPLVGIPVILGLVFGLLGDVWLDLKYVFPAEDDALTYSGFAVFGAGHILYLFGLIMGFCPQGQPGRLILPLILGVVLSLGNVFLEKPMKLRFGKMKPVVVAYGVLLFSAVLVSGSFALYYGWREKMLNLFFIGAVLFALSDLVLSGTYFGVGKDRPVDLIANYLLYYPAQYLIALSLLFL